MLEDFRANVLNTALMISKRDVMIDSYYCGCTKESHSPKMIA